MKIFSLLKRNSDTIKMTDEERHTTWEMIHKNVFEEDIQNDSQLLGFFRESFTAKQDSEQKHASPFKKNKVE